jgi:hypothetical protein
MDPRRAPLRILPEMVDSPPASDRLIRVLVEGLRSIERRQAAERERRTKLHVVRDRTLPAASSSSRR